MVILISSILVDQDQLISWSWVEVAVVLLPRVTKTLEKVVEVLVDWHGYLLFQFHREQPVQ